MMRRRGAEDAKQRERDGGMHRVLARFSVARDERQQRGRRRRPIAGISAVTLARPVPT